MEKYLSTLFILKHLSEPIFPRHIYTPLRKQIEVKSESEIYRYFKEANFIDCRINAYPRREECGIKLLGQMPDTIFIDLDLNNFRSKNGLENAKRNTLKTIKNKLDGGYPSVLHSGNGYHIYHPIDAFVLESERIFADYSRVSERFLKFAEWYLSARKVDSNHNPTFASCLLRVPETINSETNTKVKIVQEWDGYRPNIRYILLQYESWFSEEHKRKKIDNKLNAYRRPANSNFRNIANIDWIDNLLKEKPLKDSRKFVCYWIVSRYLINIKHLIPEESYHIIMDWLKGCDKLEPLSPSRRDFERLVNDDIKQAQKNGKASIGKQLLKEMNNELYAILFSSKKLTTYLYFAMAATTK